MQLDPELAAERAIARGRRRAAGDDAGDGGRGGARTVANANMADAVRLISIRRGYDPRDFALVAFGGAGPLHGAALAQELSIPTVIVPPNPGITSALGCLLVDIRHDLSTMFLRRADAADPAEIEAEFSKLEDEARERLGTRACPTSRVSLQRSIAMRYLGQWRSLSVPVGVGADARWPPRSRGSTTSTSASTLTAATARRSRSTSSSCTAVGVTPKPELAEHEPGLRAARAAARCATVSSSTATAVDDARSTARRPRRPASASPGPRRDRPARLDHARPARRRPPRSTSG